MCVCKVGYNCILIQYFENRDGASHSIRSLEESPVVREKENYVGLGCNLNLCYGLFDHPRVTTSNLTC